MVYVAYSSCVAFKYQYYLDNIIISFKVKLLIDLIN